MAVQLVTTVHNYLGLSTDSKPISGVRSGSYFYEIDTGLTFRINATGQWYIDKSATLSIGQYQSGIIDLKDLMEQVVLELRAMNEANGIETS